MKKEIAEAVLKRAGNYCEACGLPGTDFALHHRRLKSQGGKDEVWNLIAVHHKCHNLGTHSIHMRPKVAIERGQICPSWAEPSEFPLTLSDESKVLLDNEGSYIYLKEGLNGTDRSSW
jgi:hypothetical protein